MEYEVLDWFRLAHGKVQELVLVKKIMSVLIPQKAGNFLTL
jgi:hypothetical protein